MTSQQTLLGECAAMGGGGEGILRRGNSQCKEPDEVRLMCMENRKWLEWGGESSRT